MAMREAGYPISDRDFEIAYSKTDYDIYKKYKTIGKITPQEYVEWFFPIRLQTSWAGGRPLRYTHKDKKIAKRDKVR
jgi:hypothetical protein